MGVEKFSGWKTTDGQQFDVKANAEKHESMVLLQSAAYTSTHDSGFSLSDFIGHIRASKILKAALAHMLSEE